MAYLKCWYIQNYDIFKNIPKSKHIQNPAEFIRWSILLKTLRND